MTTDRRLNVLWVDDDSPKNPVSIEGFNIVTAQNCRDAAEILGKSDLPDAIIVDLVLPQAGWGDSYFITPGIELMEEIRDHVRDSSIVVVYSIAINQERAKRAREAGAVEVINKGDTSLMDVLKGVRAISDGLIASESTG